MPTEEEVCRKLAPKATFPLRLSDEDLQYLDEGHRLEAHRVVEAEDGSLMNVTVWVVPDGD